VGDAQREDEVYTLTSVKATRDPTGQRIKMAHEIAKESAVVRVGGSKAVREERSAKRVKSQRQLLRDWGANPENAKVLEEYAANNKEEKERRQGAAAKLPGQGGGATNALGLTEDISAMLEAELEEDDGEEGEEGEEVRRVRGWTHEEREGV